MASESHTNNNNNGNDDMEMRPIDRKMRRKNINKEMRHMETMQTSNKSSPPDNNVKGDIERGMEDEYNTEFHEHFDVPDDGPQGKHQRAGEQDELKERFIQDGFLQDDHRADQRTVRPTDESKQTMANFAYSDLQEVALITTPETASINQSSNSSPIDNNDPHVEQEQNPVNNPTHQTQTSNNMDKQQQQEGDSQRPPKKPSIKQCIQTKLKTYPKKAKLRYRKRIKPFRKIIVAQLVCVIYILVLTFSPAPVGIVDPSTGNIIDPSSPANTANGVIDVEGEYRPVVAIGGYQKFCLAVSRMSAFSMYPMIVVVFVTKCKATMTFLSKTPVSVYVGLIAEGHEFHAYAGRYIAWDVWIHTLFHCLRWASQGNMILLLESNAGLSGLVTVVVTSLITFPMMYRTFKDKIFYELRKGLHYLFYLFALVMCFHVPTSAIPNGGFLAPVLATCIALYMLDAIYVYLFMCEKIETTSFSVLSSGVRISMPVSQRFQRNAERGGFAYVMIPWVDDMQWHPFSLFEDPSDPSIQQMFMMKAGDWTTAVHRSLSRDTTRPCWIKGPFPSPYSHAALYDNQILVASGIGITPALAAINAFKTTRRVNLIWACRDPEMLEFFLEHMYLDHDGWNLIFYTGKKPLNAEMDSMNSNIKVVKGRPNLGSVIPNIIYGIESKEGLPENYTESSKVRMKNLLIQRIFDLDATAMSATEKVAELAEYGNVLGFSLDELIGEFRESSGKRQNESGLSALEPLSVYNPVSKKKLGPSMRSSGISTISEYDANTLLEGLKSSMRASAKRQSSLSENESSGHDSSEHFWTATSEYLGKLHSSALLKPAFHPWEKNGSQERCVKRFGNDIMTTWGIMYCGGSKPVISALKDISCEFDIDLHIDSFKW
eukprot:CAMPEP_0183722588 /NCGR_PEP_ID=MMETSP0737-20130205/14497_1 /TAXON_ID=385413 /ORGANISM="Thalassiosira miniscula, Strain CCMP1093" /LENGTH=885 /DNA_ID=CAMNT_0025952781 /DNA_START=891 /DNA_END=3548 /DNA_ORIENTATION=+